VSELRRVTALGRGSEGGDTLLTSFAGCPTNWRGQHVQQGGCQGCLAGQASQQGGVAP